MKKSSFIKLILLIFIVLSNTSCQVKDVVVGDIKSFGIEEVSGNSITVDLSTNIDNPNSFSFKINDVNLNLTINNIYLGTVNKIKPIRVKRKSNDVHHLIVQFEVDNLLEKTAQLFPSILSGKADIQVKGYIKAAHFPLSKKIKVDYHKTTTFFKK